MIKKITINLMPIIMSILLCCFPSLAFSQTEASPEIVNKHIIPTTEFTRPPYMSQLRMSPDGNYFSAIADTRNNLWVVIDKIENNGEVNPVKFKIPVRSTLNWFEWVSDNRLVYSYTYFGFRRSTLARSFLTVINAVDADGSNPANLHTEEHLFNNISFNFVHALPNDKENILLSMPTQKLPSTQVKKINIYTGEFTNVQKSYKSISSWFANANGELHAGIGVKDGELQFFVKPQGKRRWQRLKNDELIREGRFNPVSYSKDPQIMYVASSIGGGRTAIYTFDLSSGEIVEKIFEHPEVDANSVLISSTSHDLLAVTYADDQLHYHSMNENFDKTLKQINLALPDTSNTIIDISSDERYFFIYSTGPLDPGTYYRYDAIEKKLRLFMESYPEFPIDNLAEQQAVTYFARDGVEIKAYLTVPKGGLESGIQHPIVILPHAAIQSRDYKTYTPLSQFLANRGYLVMQPNYRGSSGYGALFSDLGYGEWGQAMQDDLSDAANWLATQDYTDSDRMCILGIEYAGYAALMAASQAQQVFQCALAFDPLIDLQSLIRELNNGQNSNEQTKAIALSITDLKDDELWQISPLQNAENINIPLLFSLSESNNGENDPEENKKMAKKYSQALSSAGKEFLYTPISDSFLNDIENFLQQYIPVH